MIEGGLIEPGRPEDPLKYLGTMMPIRVNLFKDKGGVAWIYEMKDGSPPRVWMIPPTLPGMLGLNRLIELEALCLNTVSNVEEYCRIFLDARQ